jgi:hypothetical protein
MTEDASSTHYAVIRCDEAGLHCFHHGVVDLNHDGSALDQTPFQDGGEIFVDETTQKIGFRIGDTIYPIISDGPGHD